MTQVNETSRPARTPRRPSAKPHGQWKVDGTAPLNHNEEFKQQDDGLNVRERIEQVGLAGGDEVQIGKYRLVFLAGPRRGEAP